mmetsp:Transcript_2066/g.4712  ORF Transcript_2066/g.4712 Transcript_2066/m.4712 type:complete len:171 (-) Transcript_2066:940-1452(-)
MRTFNRVLSKKKKKRIKYLKILKIKDKFRHFFHPPIDFRYNFFRKQFFIYRLTKDGYLKRKIFASEITEILFGFGDRDYPFKKTVAGIENLIIRYVVDIISSVTYISFWRVAKRPSIDDVFFLVRNNPRKLQRVTYLLEMKFLIEKVTGFDKTLSSLPKKKFFLPRILKV